MASNFEVTANGDIIPISDTYNTNQLTTNKTIFESQSSQYYSVDPPHDDDNNIEPVDKPDDLDETDSSSESEYEDAHEHPISLNIPSPERNIMPLEDYLEGRVTDSPSSELQERHSTLPNDVIRGPIQRVRKDYELRASRSDPNLRELIMIKDLDSGESYSLHEAADRIPQGISLDPLSNTLKQRTPAVLQDAGVGTMDDSSIISERRSSDFEPKEKKVKRKSFKRVVKTAKLMFRKKSKGPGNDRGIQAGIKFKASSRLKTPPRYQRIELIQELPSPHVGPIWTMKFSSCGKLLATGGQDRILRVWCVNSAREEFMTLKEKYKKNNRGDADVTLVDEITVDKVLEDDTTTSNQETGPFSLTPFSEYRGHLSDILDISWSNHYFMLTSSMDKTVRLWHVALGNCLSVFAHKDFVTSIAFYPNDERYFISGSLDGMLRLWHVIEKKVSLYNEVPGNGSKLITAVNFCYNGKMVVIGTYDGKCVFYDSDHLKYHTQIHVRSKHNKNSSGHKITGIIPHPILTDRLLVTSNDSRIRLYNLKDYKLECKYTGYVNTETQSKATFSPRGDYIICGSQDHLTYIWRTECDLNFKHARRDRNPCYESFSSHNSVITVAIFAPNIELFANFSPSILRNETDSPHDVILTADYFGQIKIFSL